MDPLAVERSSKEMISNMEAFIKESMCVNGTVKCVQMTAIPKWDKVLEGILFEAKDERRGTFYIAWANKEKQKE